MTERHGRRRRIMWTAALVACVALGQALIASPKASAATAYPAGRALAVIARAPGDEEVYWRGADGYLWEDAEAGGVWHGPMRTPIGGLASSPTAAVGSHGYDYVFWEGTNQQLWEAGDYPQGWIASQIGMGPLGSQPTAAALPNSSGVSEIDVFWEGTNDNPVAGLIRVVDREVDWSDRARHGTARFPAVGRGASHLRRHADPGLLEGDERRVV